MLKNNKKDNLYIITVFFNPCKFNNLRQNYYIFRNEIEKNENVNLITVELSFDGQFELVGDNIYQLSSNSIMWQKERLINYGITLLPKDCYKFIWSDCDILFLNPNWLEIALTELKENTIIQVYKKVYLSPKGEREFSPFFTSQQGVLWQYKIHKNWLNRRISKELKFSSPGFIWGVNSKGFKELGLYDKGITGSGDTIILDCLLDSEGIHGYYDKTTDSMKQSIKEYKNKLKSLNLNIGYAPLDIQHLYHGTTANRNYLPRHEILRDNNFDPNLDIKLDCNVFEWNSAKIDMHDRIKQYFFDRKEDL